MGWKSSKVYKKIMIKVLLVTNLAFDKGFVSEKCNADFGGWLTATAYALSNKGFSVGMVFKSGPSSKIYSENNIQYFCLDYLKKDFNFNEIIDGFNPDILHCEGTEYPHNKYLVENSNIPLLISLQGVLFGIDKYFMGDLHKSSLLNIRSPYSYIVYLSIFLYYRFIFKKRIKPEVEILSKVIYTTGRTDWDRAYANYLAPNSKYYSINRIVRGEFYDKKWLENLESQSVYVGNCSRSLKGFHTVLDATLLLRKKFKNLKIYVAGPNPFENRGVKGYIDYMSLVKKFICKNNLNDNFIFMGVIDAELVATTMCNVSCVVAPSFIENSPNTLVESMFLGVPTISSYAGGVASMLTHEKDGLMYRAGDEIMLADKISSILNDKEFAYKLSKNAYIRARRDHNLDSIIARYENLYTSMLNL
jgi:glycosyltransferase involved in cell wall biosynthesis